MDKEMLFGICFRAQLFYNNTGDAKAYKRWKILENRIEDAGWMEEFENWYKKNMDLKVQEFNS